MDITRAFEKSYQAVIVGGGPAGSSMAAVVAGAGISTLVVDKRKEPGRPVQCAEFISRAGFRGPVAAVSQPIENMVTHLSDGSSYVSRSPGYTIDRYTLDSYLAKRAMGKGAVYLQGATATITDRGVIMNKELGKPLNAKVIADATGGAGSRRSARSRQVTLSLGRPTPDIHVWLGPMFPGGYAWVFPKNDVANVGVAVMAKLDLKKLLEDFLRLVGSDFNLGGRPLRVTGGRIPVSGMTKLVDGNIIKVGDAAGVTHPVSGEGIQRAIRSGEMAGDAVISYISLKNVAGLASYETKLKELYGPLNDRDKKKRALWEEAVKEGGPTHKQFRRLWIGFPEYYEDFK